MAGSTQDHYLNGTQHLRGMLFGLSDEAARTRMLEQVSPWWRELLGRLMIHSPEKKTGQRLPLARNNFFYIK